MMYWLRFARAFRLEAGIGTELFIETFSGDHRGTGKGKEAPQVKKLEEKVAKKDEVISSLTEENIKLKKIYFNLLLRLELS